MQQTGLPGLSSDYQLRRYENANQAPGMRNQLQQDGDTRVRDFYGPKLYP